VARTFREWWLTRQGIVCDNEVDAHAAWDAAIAELAAKPEAVADQIKEAKLEGAFDVLLQIRSFRKRHPMENGAADTLEFIGNLYYQYEKALRSSGEAGDAAPKGSTT
jgi:hypothetical protein